MKKIFINILKKISTIIYYLIPTKLIIEELRKSRPNKHKLQIKLSDYSVEKTFQHFKEHIYKSLMFEEYEKIREYAIKTALLNDKKQDFFYLELGVYKGESANFFSKHLKKLYAFDSFEGLKEDWIGTRIPKGYFDLGKKVPKLSSNVEPIVGWVEDTLESFLKKHNPKINFVHLDMDTYSPAKFALEKLKPYMIKNSIILFDELYNYDGWEYGEYKALREVFDEKEFEYKAFNLGESQVVIKII